MFSAPVPDDDDVRLATLQRYAILDTPRERDYDDITSLASFICETPFSTITLVDQQRQWFKSEVGFGATETGRADSFCGWATASPELMIVPDAAQDVRFAENPYVTGEPKIRFYAGAPLVAPNGQVLGTVCVFDTKPRELSARQLTALALLSRQVMALMEARLLAAEKEKAAKALLQNEKLAAVGRMASNMAHQINNPLEAVSNLLYLSLQKSKDPEVRGWLAHADQELRRVAAVASQALRFHRQSSKPRKTTGLELFNTVLLAYQAQLGNCNIHVELDRQSHTAIECFDRDINQALSNLISNAVDAMSTGGCLVLRSHDGVDWKTGRPGLALTVADNGPGMDAVTRSRMYEAFFSTKGIGGSGLGLWISREIVQRHQGTIAVRSTTRAGRHGTVARIFLPQQMTAEAQAILAALA